MDDSKYIHLISGEIEAGWDKMRTDLIKDDGIQLKDFRKSVCAGELLPTNPFARKQDFFDWLKTNWPTEITHMCGFHVHVSFKSINYYAKLMEPNFYTHFLNCMDVWGKNYPITNPRFWERLYGKNRFCVKLFEPDQQVLVTSKESKKLRYAQLNFCYNMHKTMECRLFPTFIDSDVAVSAVQAFIDCIESFLSDSKVQEDFEIEQSLSRDDKDFVEMDKAVSNFKSRKFNLYAIDSQLNGTKYIPEYAIAKTGTILVDPCYKTKYDEQVILSAAGKISPPKLKKPKFAQITATAQIENTKIKVPSSWTDTTFEEDLDSDNNKI